MLLFIGYMIFILLILMWLNITLIKLIYFNKHIKRASSTRGLSISLIWNCWWSFLQHLFIILLSFIEVFIILSLCIQVIFNIFKCLKTQFSVSLKFFYTLTNLFLFNDTLNQFFMFFWLAKSAKYFHHVIYFLFLFSSFLI